MKRKRTYKSVLLLASRFDLSCRERVSIAGFRAAPAETNFECPFHFARMRKQMVAIREAKRAALKAGVGTGGSG
jgi:hypothetical protein